MNIRATDSIYSVKFTCEEEEGSIAFMDMLIVDGEGGIVTTSVFSKKTQTN